MEALNIEGGIGRGLEETRMPLIWRLRLILPLRDQRRHGKVL